MTLVTITWSDGDTATLDLTIDAIKFYQDLGLAIIFLPDEPIIEPTPEPEPTPTPEPPPSTQEPPPSTQNPPMLEQISISPGVFQIINDRIAGEVLYIAGTFEGTQAKANLQIKNSSGIVLVLKENILNFTETQRDERIFYNENAFGETSLTAQLSVLDMNNVPLTGVKSFPVTKLEPIAPPPFLPPVIGARGGVAGTPFGIAAIGLLGLGVLGALGVGKKKK